MTTDRCPYCLSDDLVADPFYPMTTCVYCEARMYGDGAWVSGPARRAYAAAVNDAHDAMFREDA